MVIFLFIFSIENVEIAKHITVIIIFIFQSHSTIQYAIAQSNIEPNSQNSG